MGISNSSTTATGHVAICIVTITNATILQGDFANADDILQIDITSSVSRAI